MVMRSRLISCDTDIVVASVSHGGAVIGTGKPPSRRGRMRGDSVRVTAQPTTCSFYKWDQKEVKVRVRLLQNLIEISTLF